MNFLDSIFKKREDDSSTVKNEQDVLKDKINELEKQLHQAIETSVTLEEKNDELKVEIILLKSQNEEFKAIVDEGKVTENRINELIDLRLEKVVLKQKLLNKSLIEIIKVQDENFELIDEDIDQRKDDLIKVTKCVDTVNDRINKETNKINEKIDGILELMSEKIVRNEPMPNVFTKEISLRQLWDSMSDKKDAALLAIVYMMRKHFEEKGVRLK